MEKDQYKIGLTARQAGLGSVEWVEEDKKKPKRALTEVKEKKESKNEKPADKRGRK